VASGCRRRRGTALVESVLAIPLLAGVLVLIWWVGWAMNNQQRVRSAANYEAWRGVHGGEVTGIETVEFASRGVVRDVVRDGGPWGTRDEVVELAAVVGQDAAELADRGPRNRFPAGWMVTMTAEFPTSVSLWNRVQNSQGDMRVRTGRDGVTWRRGEAFMRTPIVEMYISELETRMESVPEPGDAMAQMVRNLYRGGW